MERVLYVCASEPDDVGAWSGSTYHIYHALKRSFAQVDPLVVRGGPMPFLERVYGSLQHRFFGRRSYYELRHSVTRGYAAQIGEQLAAERYDAVFAPGTIYLAALQTDVPCFATADACLGGLAGYYEEFTNLTPRDLAQGYDIERRAAAACRKVFYTSKWARETAVATAGASPDRAKVVPFGANLLSLPDASDADRFAGTRDRAHISMLFVGVDWRRKGGQIAFEAVKALNAKGSSATLHVVGGAAPAEVMQSDCVKHHGFLRKADPDHLAQLLNLYRTSHFLILPTRAECCAVVFAEACAFGLPVLATRTGGVETAVRTGISGETFDYDAPPECYADRALALLEDPEGYRALCRSAKALADTELNWDVCASVWKREMEEKS